MKIRNIVLGITGGIACYKSAYIASGLNKAGYNIDVIMTENAQEFISPIIFETLTKNSVVTDMFKRPSHIDVEHISLAVKADMVLVAPATYNIINKVAAGIADDMLSTVISATKAPVFFALAMNSNMYENPILQENIEKLKKLGYHFIDSDTGILACDVAGKGRMKEPEEILRIVDNFFNREKILLGKKVLITAGRTEESIDPVRYISNRSTGKMGFAIAEAAIELGAEVSLVSGPVSINEPNGVRIERVTSAIEMYEAVSKEFSKSDIVIMTAAVADYRVKDYSEQKIKKVDGEMVINLVRNPDILYEMGKIKERQFLVGFAAESENLIENAMEKLVKKNLDMIIANDASNFGKDSNKTFFINRNKEIKEQEIMLKKELAFHIFEEIVKNLEKK